MIEQFKRTFNIGDAHTTRVRRALDQRDGNGQGTGSAKLAVGRGTTAVLGDDEINIVTFQKLDLIRLRKRAARQNIGNIWQIKRRGNRVDAANDIMMLGSFQKRRDFLSAKGYENAARLSPGKDDRVLDRSGLAPVIAGTSRPGRAIDGKIFNAGSQCSSVSIGGNISGKRVRDIDQNISSGFRQIADETLHAAKTPDAHGHRLRHRLACPASKRERDIKLGSVRNCLRQEAGFRRAAQYKDTMLIDRVCHGT